MKKLTCLFLVLVILTGLTACGKDGEKAEREMQPVSSSVEPKKPEIVRDKEPAEEIIEDEPVAEVQPEEIVEESAIKTEPADEQIEDEDLAEEENELVNEETPDRTGSEEMVDGMRVSFKEAMDSYEAFYDEYVVFMKKYHDSDDSLSMLPDYLKLIAKAEEANKKLDEWDSDTLNDVELKYYLEVTSRVTQKLVDVAA